VTSFQTQLTSAGCPSAVVLIVGALNLLLQVTLTVVFMFQVILCTIDSFLFLSPNMATTSHASLLQCKAVTRNIKHLF